jgi:CheY-like chemotaxis protein
MDQETLARATEPFFTTKGIGKGTGLGLPMVHGVAQQSGGRLVLKSEKGRGTTAELWLPVAKVPIKAELPAPQPVTPVPTRPLSIVAVDDDSIVLSNTVAMLEELGHTVFAAISGDRALEILNNEKLIDLVIADQAMPGMTGAQLAGKIQQQWPTLPVILATGYAELPPGIAEGLKKLLKPFDQRELARAVNEVIKDEPAVPPAAISPA